jgi:hypothetical protein
MPAASLPSFKAEYVPVHYYYEHYRINGQRQGVVVYARVQRLGRPGH